MKELVFYCRLTIKIDADKVLMPFFMNGKNEKEVNAALIKMVNTIHNEGIYMVNAFEIADLSLEGEANEERLKEKVLSDFGKGVRVSIPLSGLEIRGVNMPFKEIAGMSLPLIGARQLDRFDGYRSVKVPAISVKYGHGQPMVRVFPYLTIVEDITGKTK